MNYRSLWRAPLKMLKRRSSDLAQNGLVFMTLLTVATNLVQADLRKEPPAGKLMLFGGAERDSNTMLWHSFVEAAGGKGAKVAIFPTASNFPERTGNLFAKQMRELGLEPFVVPLSPLLKSPDSRSVVRDPIWIEKVRNADAVFLAGGEQLRYRTTLIDPTSGQETPLLLAIRSVYERGGLVAGTSAGTAVMSRMMFIDAEKIVPVLVEGVHVGKEVDHGLSFLPNEWFVDQHFLSRGRFGRALVAMKELQFNFCLGIDEDTAVIIERGEWARVVGYRGAIILDATQAVHNPEISRFHWKGIRISYLSHGDAIHLNTREIKLGPAKRPEDLIDPKSTGFQPYYSLKQFYTDIFANYILLDLMMKLVDGPHEEAYGIAFDGQAASAGVTPGFKFRFFRKADTLSWDSPIAIGDSLTIQNVYLDITPIDLQGPIFLER